MQGLILQQRSCEGNLDLLFIFFKFSGFHLFPTFVISGFLYFSSIRIKLFQACQNIKSKEHYNGDWKEHKINLK